MKLFFNELRSSQLTELIKSTYYSGNINGLTSMSLSLIFLAKSIGVKISVLL